MPAGTGVRVFAPDVNTQRCALYRRGRQRDPDRSRLCALLGGDAARRIVLEREANGPYRSLADFMRRCPIGSRAIENLIVVGAFDRFGLGRREALWQVGLFIPSKRFGSGKRTPADRKGRQIALALPVAAGYGRACGRWVRGSRWRPITRCSACRPGITRWACCAIACLGTT